PAEASRRQQEMLAEKTTEFDVVVTTALVPGRPAPRLVTKETVAGMRPGSVIVDLAAEAGGNCELTEPDQVVVRHGVIIHGPTNLPATMSVHASQLYARNVSELVRELVKDGALALDFDAEVVRGACVTHGGAVMNDAVRAEVAARKSACRRCSGSASTSSCWPGSSATTSSPASRRCCTRRSCRRPTPSRRSRWSGRWWSPAATTATSRTAGCVPSSASSR